MVKKEAITKSKEQELDKDKEQMQADKPLGEKQENNNSRVKLDEILKSLFGVSKRVLIQMMNSLFKENFDLKMTDITFENNEFVSDEYDIIRGDLFLKLSQGDKPHHYHIELQTKNDRSMVIRMFEYGFKKAKEIAKYSNNRNDDSDETVIYIPRQLVIFIEQNSNIKDELKMRLIFPDGQNIQYTVPVIKYWKYDAKTIIEEKIYPLLPLQVFKLRYKMESIKKRGESNKTDLIQAVLEAKEEAEKIALEGKRLYEKGEITGEDLHKILLAVGNLFEYLNDKYGEDEKLVEEVLQVTKTLYDPVVAEEALAKGKKEGILTTAKNAILKGIDTKVIMDITGLTKKEIEEIKEELSS